MLRKVLCVMAVMGFMMAGCGDNPPPKKDVKPAPPPAAKPADTSKPADSKPK